MINIDREKLEEESQNYRRLYNYGDAPIGANIFNLLEHKLKFSLIRKPIEGDNPGAFIRSLNDHITVFLNSNMYIDKQIFGAAHELYHYLFDIRSDKKRADICNIHSDEDESENENERRANYFAAVFLLPSRPIKERIEDGTGLAIDQLLYHVVRLQCEFEVPYKTVVKRLLESKIILKEQFDDLMRLKPRDKEGPVFQKAQDLGDEFFEKFCRLNTRNKIIYFSRDPHLKAVDNYKSNKITYNKLESVLSWYNTNPEKFGIEPPKNTSFNLSIDLDEEDDDD
ncbi:ImmA/IrrE family metallo-endopeptidase [Rossellomorea vietnamensis]|uniref:ImmA/IrrE family metallo-endopeptidase n=1 Tax=Rossellomorea vietnamensis TaxID=218284 RepID=A0A6I6UMN3_9BACI|nr:ImmA/IrrE family metallo-endopeptidase [Rossellomorea vietnamensis]QHE62597.1 ImmA/IrrE family metallo-endopeptidase [Rossellomorea vietnamensis]